MSGSTAQLEYGEYKDLIDTLEQSNVEDSYQKLMGKEDKVLDTINRSIKFYRDEKQKKKEFIHLDIIEIELKIKYIMALYVKISVINSEKFDLKKVIKFESKKQK